MLKLDNIIKDYYVADTTVHALKGVSLTFRKNEFVSVLGPSGCGKTTLLNIIGGLDHYTDGELFINGVSTKRYADRDWDNYRNHSIGFVFQSYNLIPHQTISENVELALSISGVDKAERVRRAHEALDKVGLKGQYRKKPNQLSGGQCQRVAIARALVNEPEILLADEPTGALDTETSVQIMDIIKEIARERLVIMVTHNPEIAQKYSTRIINLLDGEVISDSNPYDGNDADVSRSNEAEAPVESDAAPSATVTAKGAKVKKQKKSKLSAMGAFKLSARNLWSKLKRTILVCVAGSIGIVGVATVLAVSSGVKGYIAGMQDDMLSGNPISVSTTALDAAALMSMSDTLMKGEAVENSVQDGYINVNLMIEYLVSRGNDMASLFVENDLTQEYVDYVDAMPKEFYNALVKTYGVDLSNNLYTDYRLYGENQTLSVSAALEMYSAMLEETEYEYYSRFVSNFAQSFRIAPDNEEYILSQYDILGRNGKIATKANEIMLVVSKDSTLTDLMLAQFGYFSQEEFLNLVYKAVDDPNYNETIWKDKFSYEELVGKTFTWYPNDRVFNKTEYPDSTPDTMRLNPFTYNPASSSDWNDGSQIELTITAVLRPKDSISYGCLRDGFYYTNALTEQILSRNGNSEIVNYLKERSEDGFSSAEVSFGGNKIRQGITYDYHFSMKDDKTGELSRIDSKGFVGSVSQMSMMGSMMGFAIPEQYTLTLRNLGGNSLANGMYVYPISFDNKDLVTNYLSEWNGKGSITFKAPQRDEAGNVIKGDDGQTLYADLTIARDDRSDVVYNDNLELVITMINQFIDIITTALIAFTALSLVVSTVMIAIITYVSVMERIKEIGVIRSLGGRKRDVSNLFIAETFIIGGISGIFGIAVTYGISGILNLILGKLFSIYTIAALPLWQALIMICVSIGLTLISGLIPASLAAKKDPVESLRTE